MPLDAIPDLSDAQVIVYTDWEGRSPDLVEDQITYPISTRFIAAPKVKFVRGESMFGKSFVYVIFEDGTDIYWARSRVIEYLNSVRGSLPEGVNPVIGPDATGVGWVFEYALVDETGQHDLAELALPSGLAFALRAGIRAGRGGGRFRRRLCQGIPGRSRSEQAGRLWHPAGRGRRQNPRFQRRRRRENLRDRRDGILHPRTRLHQERRRYRRHPAQSPWAARRSTCSQVGTVHLGPDLRRGVAELDGKGETVGGIVVMRYGENALNVIDGVKRKLHEIEASLPPGVKIVPTYDRSGLILDSIKTLREKLIEESIVVALVCLVFLWHVRSALVAIITLPVAILLSSCRCI